MAKIRKDGELKETHGNYPCTYTPKEETTRAILKQSIALAKQPPCETNEELVERFNWFFNWCMEEGMKPTVEGFALAMGVHRSTLTADWETGASGLAKQEIAKKGKDIIFHFLTTATMDNEVNNVTWMFYGKNYYGYQDKRQVEVSANVGQMSEDEQERIAKLLPDGDNESNY